MTIWIGEAQAVLDTLPAQSVHMIVTSPPYWGLRDYGTADWEGGDPSCEHKGEVMRTAPAGTWFQALNKGAVEVRSGDCACGARRIDEQLGLEPTPELFTERLVAILEAARRVLRDDGTLWLNLGDTYCSQPAGNKTPSGFQQQDLAAESGARAQIGSARGWEVPPGLKQKDLVMVPEMVALSLRAAGWYLRADIIWSKPHSMPESVSDRPTLTHEHLFLLTKRPRYFYDLEAIREPIKTGNKGEYGHGNWERTENGEGFSKNKRITHYGEIKGANAKSVWTIGIQPTTEAHFATFPQALVRRCIMAGTSEHGCCPGCGAQWVRQLEVERNGSSGGVDQRADLQHGGVETRGLRLERRVADLGWAPGCDCDAGDPIPSTVLDPFMGSGTTALVARALGRRSVGIELNPEYVKGIIERRTAQQSLFTEAYV